MKPAFIILTIAILFLNSFVSGREFAGTTDKNQVKFENYSIANFSHYNKQKKWCDAHKAGLIMIGVGSVTTLGILSIANDANRSSWLGLAIAFYAGGILIVAGTPIFIAGAIHDHYQRRISIVSPKNNQIGLAYNF